MSMGIDRYINFKELGFDIGIISLLAIFGDRLEGLMDMIIAPDSPLLVIIIMLGIKLLVAMQIGDIASDYLLIKRKTLCGVRRLRSQRFYQ